MLSNEEISALHFIKRTGQRFGRVKIKKALDGVRDAGVVASKLDLHPEFGSCKNIKGKAHGVVESLYDQGYLRTTCEPKYTALALTNRGYRELRLIAAQVAADEQDIDGPSKICEVLDIVRFQLSKDHAIATEAILSDTEINNISWKYCPEFGLEELSLIIGSDRSIYYGARILNALETGQVDGI